MIHPICSICSDKGSSQHFRVKNNFPEEPPRLDKYASEEDRQVQRLQTQEREMTLAEIENRKKQIWFYLAKTLNSFRLMLILNDCVEENGFEGGNRT